MLKIDSMNTLFNCDVCKELLVEPITIPCGNTLCKTHLEEFVNSESVYKCILCHKKHKVPEEGFIVNKRIQNALDFENLKLKQSAAFFECKQKIEEAKQQAESIDSLAEDPDLFINERFDLVKNHINWRRDELKVEIDTYAEKLIQSIESERFCCIQKSKENPEDFKHLVKEIDELKEELDEVIQFYTFEKNPMFENIKKSVDEFSQRISNMILEYKKSLFMHKDYLFIFYDRPMEDVLGSVIDKNTNLQTDSIKEEPLDTRLQTNFNFVPTDELNEKYLSDVTHLKLKTELQLEPVDELEINEYFEGSSEKQTEYLEDPQTQPKSSDVIEPSEDTLESSDEPLVLSCSFEESSESSLKKTEEVLEPKPKLYFHGFSDKYKGYKQLAYDDQTYYFSRIGSSNELVYLCENIFQLKCSGLIKLADGIIVKQDPHTCDRYQNTNK